MTVEPRHKWVSNTIYTYLVKVHEGKTRGFVATVSAVKHHPYQGYATVSAMIAYKPYKNMAWNVLVPYGVDQLRSHGVITLISICDREAFEKVYKKRGWIEYGTQEEEQLGDVVMCKSIAESQVQAEARMDRVVGEQR